MVTLNLYRNKLKAASYFMAVNDIRFYLNGIKIESSPAATRVIATNGHTMFIAYDDAKGDNVGSFAGILPADVVKTILSWKLTFKSANDAPVVLHAPEEPAAEHRAEWCGNVCVFKLIDATFPDYTRVIPKSVSGEAAFYAPEYLMQCSKAALAMGSNKLGTFALKQGGETSPGIAVFSTSAFAVLMPMRGEQADLADIAWAQAAIADEAEAQA